MPDGASGRPSFLWTGAGAMVGWAAAVVMAVAVSHGASGRAAGGAAALAVAAGLATVAFRVEASRAFGPPGSPERRARRLAPGVVVRRTAAGFAGAALFAIVLGATDDGTWREAVAMGVVFGAALAASLNWRAWRRPDEDPIPAPRPKPEVPPHDRRVDLRRGEVVGVVFAVLGIVGAPSGLADGDAGMALVGLALVVGGGWFAYWCSSRPEVR